MGETILVERDGAIAEARGLGPGASGPAERLH
jgi:hypothetical protein